MAPLLYRYRHALSLNFTLLSNPCWTHYFTNFYKISFLHWVTISNFIFINFFHKCSYKALKCLYFSRPGADMVLHALPCTFVHLPSKQKKSSLAIYGERRVIASYGNKKILFSRDS